MEKTRLKKVIKFLDKNTIIRVVSEDISVFGIKEYKLSEVPNNVIKFGAVSYFGKKECCPLVEVYIPETFCWRLFIWLDNIFEENDYDELRSAKLKCHCSYRKTNDMEFYEEVTDYNTKEKE